MEIENQELEINMQGEPYIKIINGKVDSVNGMTGDVVLDASDVNALPDSTLYGASLVLTIDSSTYVLTGELKDQNGDTLGVIQSIDLPLESMVVGGEYDENTKSIILTLKNGQTVSFSVADLVSGLQTEITPSNKLSSDLVDDTGHTNKFITQAQLDKLNAIVEIKSIGAGLTLSSSGELSADSGDFFTASESVSALGNNITMTNTLPVAIKSVELDGDTTQQTYSGKNLYDYTDTTSVGSGITVGSDGWVTVSYDNTNGTGTHYESYFTDVILQLSTSTNYAVVTEIKDVAVNNTSIKLYSVSGSSVAQFSNTITVIPSDYPNGGTDVHVISTLSSFVSSTSSLRTAVSFPAGSKGTFSFRISLLANTSVTPETFSYEPYVGGTTSPNPDYPQDVNVVTGTQTVTVNGKNLFGIGYLRSTTNGTATISDGIITLIPNGIGNIIVRMELIKPLPAGTYILNSSTYLSTTTQLRNETDSATIYNFSSNYQNVTFTTTEEAPMIRFNFVNPGNTNPIYIDLNTLQIEAGSTATPFQPYQSQSYTVNLGSTELCKIGDYQDYIYKSGDDWYVHKEVGKYTFNGNESWNAGTYGTNPWLLSNVISTSYDASKIQIMSEVFRGVSNDDRSTSGNNIIYTTSNVQIYVRNTSLTSLADIQSATNGTYLYYALATPTDTKITDASLISDLNALAGASTYTDLTYITSTATGTNLPVILDIEAYRKSLAGIIANL